MKAKDVTKGAVLWWEPRKWGFGDKVRVIDPAPIYGRSTPWSSDPVKNRGTGVLVEVVHDDGRVSQQRAAQLRHLLGPYDEVKKQRAKEERAQKRAEDERRKQGDRLRREADRLQRQARKVGVSAYAKVNYDRWVTVSVPANQFKAMLDALPEGWKPPVDPEEE